MLKGNSLKWISLFVLIAQTTALVLTLRYSRTQKTKEEGPKYLSSTAVLMAEIVKLFTCIAVLLHFNDWSFNRFWRELDSDIFQRVNDTLKMGVPALLYASFFILNFAIN